MEYLPTLLIELSQNLALFLVLPFLYSLFVQAIPRLSSKWNSLLLGGMFGIAALIGMLIPINIAPEIIIDSRLILVGLAGTFGGIIGASVAATPVCVSLVVLGGADTIPGLGAVLTAMLIGGWVHRFQIDKNWSLKSAGLIILGFAFAAGGLLWSFALPGEVAWQAFKAHALPVAICYPLGSLILGALFLRERTRLQVEKPLREGEERFRTLVDQAPDIMFLYDLEGSLLEVNQCAAKSLGFTREELLDMGVADVDAEFETLGQAKHFWGTLVPGEAILLEGQYRCKDGTTFPVEINFSLLELKGRPAVLTLARDITDRKQAEAIIHERLDSLIRPEADASDLSFSDLFDLDEIQKVQDAFAKATGVASIITDTEGRPITKPSNFCRLCRDIIRKTEKGLTKCMYSASVLGSPSPVGPSMQPCLSGGLWDGGASIMVGDRHIANWLIGQVRNEQQDEEGMLAYAREIGADEEAFRAALAEVNVMSTEQFSQVCQALFVMARQLSTLAYQNMQQARAIHDRDEIEEALRENDRIKTEFIKTVAHEFRTPLTSIQGFSEFLLTHEQPSPEKQKECLGYIHQRSVALAGLVDDILDIARIEAGKGLALNLSACSVTEVLRQVEPFLKGQASRQRFEVSLKDDDTLLHVDKGKIGQVLENLLSNAIKFSEGVSSIRILGGLFEERYRISVVDNGLGMTREQVEKIFDKFYRADASDTAVEGVGLGMHIVKHIVESHGGRIWVESELGQGTTVNFTLPLAREIEKSK